ncbi:MAG: hypothetical protein LLG13_05120 [Bacteroidales bacterium]|nr:hypothetical protein [Bacteroidales bacterium]
MSYKASFLFAPGEYRMPRSKLEFTSVPDYFLKISKYLDPQLLFETNNFLVYVYLYEDQRVVALIDKSSKKSYLNYLNDNDIDAGILNNLDGGTMLEPKSYFEENGREYMIGFVTPYKLKIHVTSSEFKNATPSSFEKKKELEKLANSLKETDNPVLMIVRLKK